MVNPYCISLLHFRRLLPSHPLRRYDNDDAADIRERSAANAPFQRYQPSQPPVKIVNSAALRELHASHFGGSNAKYAKSANQILDSEVGEEGTQSYTLMKLSNRGG